MNKKDAVWLNNVEYTVMENNGWKIILVANHLEHKFWYEIKNPEESYLDFSTKDIYTAIDRINQETKEKQERIQKKKKRNKEKRKNLKLYLKLLKIILKYRISNLKVLFELKDSEE